MAEEQATGTELTSPLRGEVGAQRRVRGRKSQSGAVAKARSLRRRQTDAERYFWSAVRNRRVDGYKFVRQYPVGPYIADFVCRETMLVVEIDGGQHAGSKADIARTAYLDRQGYAVLRFWNNDILTNIDGVLTVLAEHLKAKGNPA